MHEDQAGWGGEAGRVGGGLREAGGLRLGTRGSRLALTQSTQVARALEAAGGPALELVTVRTRGDGDRTPLRQLGGIGVFAARLRLALLEGEVDMAVHSCKDLPSAGVDGLELICVPAREDPRDALCARERLTLETLPRGARVGTGSPRRAAQLLALRPDVEVVDLRGNVPTRLARVRGLAAAAGVGRDEPVAPVERDAEGDLDAVILAAAGLGRLGLGHCATQLLDPSDMLPAPAQGALAVEARAGALAGCPALEGAVGVLEDPATRLAVTAERALMAALGAGCAAPLGAWARVVADDEAPPAPSLAPADQAVGDQVPQASAGAGCALELRAVVVSPGGRERASCLERVALGRWPSTWPSNWPGQAAGAGEAAQPGSPARASGGAAGQGSSDPGTGPASAHAVSSGGALDLVAADELGRRAAAALLDDGAGRIVDLRAGRPGRR